MHGIYHRSGRRRRYATGEAEMESSEKAKDHPEDGPL
jgi:hypothetical protein